MKQITEDYCSFEIAKLLKEKGFANLIDHYYDTSGRMDGDFTTEGFPCCTHQMALKWLREVHDLHIVVYPWQADNEEKAIHWCCTVYKSFAHLGNDVYTNETPKSYEEAVEAACLYVLKNLI